MFSRREFLHKAVASAAGITALALCDKIVQAAPQTEAKSAPYFIYLNGPTTLENQEYHRLVYQCGQPVRLEYLQGLIWQVVALTHAHTFLPGTPPPAQTDEFPRRIPDFPPGPLYFQQRPGRICVEVISGVYVAHTLPDTRPILERIVDAVALSAEAYAMLEQQRGHFYHGTTPADTYMFAEQRPIYRYLFLQQHYSEVAARLEAMGYKVGRIWASSLTEGGIDAGGLHVCVWHPTEKVPTPTLG